MADLRPPITDTRMILELITKGIERYAPPLEGQFYETSLLEIDGQKLIVKRLKMSDQLPAGSNRDRRSLFETHQSEYEKMRAVFEGSGMVLPTVFISDLDNQEFITIQHFVANPILQYKIWEKAYYYEFPDLGEFKQQQIEAFHSLQANFKQLLDNIHPYLIDVDFFIIDQEPWVVIFDTSHFWVDKLEGKDRARKERNFDNFYRTMVGSR